MQLDSMCDILACNGLNFSLPTDTALHISVSFVSRIIADRYFDLRQFETSSSFETVVYKYDIL